MVAAYCMKGRPPGVSDGPQVRPGIVPLGVPDGFDGTTSGTRLI